jgi:hypothetical protein
MKKIFLRKLFFYLILFTSLSIESYGQLFNQKKGDLIVSGGISQLSIEKFETKLPIGIQHELMLLDGIGVQGSIAATKDYFEFGTGTLSHAILLLISRDDNPNLGLGWIALPFFFENTTFHFRIANGVEFIPYLSLWRVRYYWEPNDLYLETIFHSGSIGTKLTLKAGDEWFISSFTEVTYIYGSDRQTGWQAGINIGKLYPRRRAH